MLDPGDKKAEPFISKKHAERLINLADKHDGAHIFAVSGRGEPNWETVIRPHFRLRQISASAIGRTGRGEFDPLCEELKLATDEEDYWISSIKPQESGAPLVLPYIFSANREVREMWRLAEGYNSRRNLEAAAVMIERFRRVHRQSIGAGKTPWIDGEDWIWNDSGARHGMAVFPEDWKYSYRLPDGFHFDVSCQKGTKKRFRDAHGAQHAVSTHVNVTAHGTIRGM